MAEDAASQSRSHKLQLPKLLYFCRLALEMEVHITEQLEAINRSPLEKLQERLYFLGEIATLNKLEIYPWHWLLPLRMEEH
ncbi:conserved hypothetical protein [Ricinus communis]|uniref:Uncharacterized protein n=1 Tax=Ricinus communis TaxID=3988 RepID=B9R7T4_RICCO|nr:conserved hypothetical protein [Ricinus communis]